MRFFLDFFSCGGSATMRSSESTTKPPALPASRSLRRKKREAPDWRPSLGSISEDSAVPQSERGSGRDHNKRSSSSCAVVSSATAKVHHHRNYSDDYHNGLAAMPTIMPPFSPTPFMF